MGVEGGERAEELGEGHLSWQELGLWAEKWGSFDDLLTLPGAEQVEGTDELDAVLQHSC